MQKYHMKPESIVKKRLKYYWAQSGIEAGCDEAGRGCLAGPVFAAAVILPRSYRNPLLNDSKKVAKLRRDELRRDIEDSAIAFAVASATAAEIDEINILQASILAMHRAIAALGTPCTHLLIDGNQFLPYHMVPHTCIVGGDGKYSSIAAASILAKTYRDEYMLQLHDQFPQYGWDRNKGYGTAVHRAALAQYGKCSYHRRSFLKKYGG